VLFSFAARRPSLGQRLTASFAVVIVLALTVLAASPDLHERLHELAPQEMPGHGHAGHAHAPGSPLIDDDDDCAVVLFSQGVILALALAVFFVASGRVAAYLAAHVPQPAQRDLKLWYPPLCGPPVS
jgi:hypothetical protein